ncbi:MAG TPA: hypothetical protein ENH62_16130 [Marinobacter sp.]|nr:hypothetical protein [Marinobacter sp.]
MVKPAFGAKRSMCVVVHGIEYDPSVVSWVDDFVIDSAHRTDVELFPEVYGYVSGWKVWMYPDYRRDIVEREVKALKRLKCRLLEWDPSAKFSILAHSLGGTIVEEALKQDFVFENIIIFMGAMDENFNWHDHNAQFNHAFIWWSPKDEKLDMAYWGKQGLVGPQVIHPRVYSIKTDWTHDEFMDRWYLNRPVHNTILSQIETGGY